MIRTFVTHMSLIQAYVFITFFVALLFYKQGNRIPKALLAILFINFVAELVSLLLVINNMQIGTLISISSFLHNCLWLLLLFKLVKRRRLYRFLFLSFCFFAAVNFIWFEGITSFNTKTFIFGAFFYLVVFIYESFYELQKERFDFFVSNSFLMLSAPVLFFIGLSAVFGFKDARLGNTILFGHIFLYQFIVYFVNIFYYSLIIVYIYREKKLKDAE
jgi:hypothetical protein